MNTHVVVGERKIPFQLGRIFGARSANWSRIIKWLSRMSSVISVKSYNSQT